MKPVISELARSILESIEPYIPGKPISEVAREFGVTDIIKLASNENPAGPSPKAIAAVQAALAEVHLYPDGAAYTLRQKLSARFDYPADGILIGNGSVEIMELVCEAFLEPGLEAITGPQAFFKYRIACQIMGVQPVMIPMPNYNYDVDAIIKAITPKTRLVFIANPNNPTGTYLPKAQVDRLIGALPPRALLVLDEAYFEFADKPDYPNGLDYVRQGKRVVATRTFSKAYGLAGLRCGYAFAAPEIVAAMHKVREVFNCNSLAQVAGEAALDDVEFLQATLKNNRIGLGDLKSGLTKLGLKTVPSAANFILTDFGRPIGPIFTELLKRGVIVRPMGPYDLPSCARISVGFKEHHQKLFQALSQIL
jgi:histidinol-phosphate aminotransferase